MCPACRTPYGDDPHEFSAVDVEEVLKANKEKEAAAKRERERQRQQSSQTLSSDANSDDGEGIATLTGQMEVPKDRNQLANMRVIRRNLVYAVGLPSSIASEDILRKADYFGQYGKISKIVLNRSQTTGGDPRRATASAYVTFAHKEDTLACILALDGFYMEGRNIRASYGTSKYCSAFIKNVRCNNPECTYLHQMGDVEDTFTKQEIQAGYVTSGRDVLARQQQIVQQALSAASGAAGSAPRRRTGGGGPSGTGRAATSPVFPPPTFDEPTKPTPPLVPPPPGTATARSASVNSTTAFPTIAAANAVSAATLPVPTTIARSASAGATTGIPKVPIGSAAQISRKSVGPVASGPISAASVVAGVHSVSNEPPAPHTTLTPLTPLKRSNVSKGTAKSSESAGLANINATTKLTNLRTGSKKNGIKMAPAPGSPGSHGSSQKSNPAPIRGVDGPFTIGGAVIATPAIVPPVRGPTMTNMNNDHTSPLASLGGEPLSGLGGEVFNGPLKSSGNNPIIGHGYPIGGNNKDKWNSIPLGGDPVVPSGPGGLWGSGGNQGGQDLAPGHNSRQVGGNVIGGGPIGGGFQGSGSSALASMLGINLPTGSGSLRESTDLWGTPIPQSQPQFSALHGSSLPTQGVIGPGVSNQNNGLIGGVIIGGGSVPMGHAPIGGGGNTSDIALLQSLLPGVHITSGNSYSQGNGFGTIGGGNDWNSAPGINQSGHHPANGGMQQQGQQWNGGLQSTLGGTPIGAIGQGGMKQNQRQAPGSIW